MINDDGSSGTDKHMQKDLGCLSSDTARLAISVVLVPNRSDLFRSVEFPK
ncbi:hypothetical protein [Phaffia rhodozyma]|uniref:Uncharacterized protein n=1 Tax=Phaffia rhodozyma TaxID=264483 RepID=A0A0F7SJJ1_PHARH|nr:hypothetical protein [Phaffia rhodozyma]